MKTLTLTIYLFMNRKPLCLYECILRNAPIVRFEAFVGGRKRRESVGGAHLGARARSDRVLFYVGNLLHHHLCRFGHVFLRHHLTFTIQRRQLKHFYQRAIVWRCILKRQKRQKCKKKGCKKVFFLITFSLISWYSTRGCIQEVVLAISLMKKTSPFSVCPQRHPDGKSRSGAWTSPF